MTDEKNLVDLAMKWLNESPFMVKKNCILEGKSGEDYKIDFMLETSLKKENEDSPSKLAIKVVDQNRSLGTNIINKFDNIS